MWLAARLSCATAVMADTRRQLIAAIRESWRLTWEEQWGIVRYLALIGFAVAAVMVGAAVAAGSADRFFPGERRRADRRSARSSCGWSAAVPFAFLAVLCPPGFTAS